jgi:hypothetical protein
MAILRTSIALVLGALFLASTANAQSETAPGAAVSFAGGVASTDSTTGAVLGGSVLFDVNNWVALEGEGSYLDRGTGADALSVGGSLLINLLPRRGRIVPYAAVGGGMYRASFDMGNPRMLGSVASQFQSGAVVCPAPGTGMGFGPGVGFGSGTGVCPANVAGYWGVGSMPAFYGRRLGPMVIPDTGDWGTRSFVDPAATIGGGIRFHVSDRIMIRPDIRARMIFADGDTDLMAVFAFNVGYRF